MKKILFLINTLGDGGAERVLVDLVNHLDRALFHVTVQTVLDVGVRKKELAEDIEYRTIIRTENSRLRNFCAKLITKIIPPQLVYFLFVKNDYDIEIAFLEGLPTKIIAASCNKKGRKIAWIHTDLCEYPDSVRAYSSFHACRKAYKQFDQIVGVSRDVAAQFKNKFAWKKENINVLYNVIDDKRIQEYARENTGIPSKSGILRVTTCGRLIKQKAFDRLLRIHKRLIDEGLHHELWILGEGPERETLEAYILEHNLNRTVSLCGFFSNPYPYFANSDLFVCSSVAEGYSIVMTEACLLGIPVLTTKVSGAEDPPECPRYSQICENDEESLYHALKQILENPQLLEQYKTEMKAKSVFFSMSNQMKVIEDFLCTE